MSSEVLRTRGLPFSLMTTTHGLMIVSDGRDKHLFTYCPQLGVMPGLGDFDDNPRMYTPKSLQLFNAPLEDLVRIKREWDRAASENVRPDSGGRDKWRPDAFLPFIAARDEEVRPDEKSGDALAAFAAVCDELEEA